jgi:hypothetical protein
MIATMQQARDAIAKMPRDKINELVRDIIEAVYGEEIPEATEDDDEETQINASVCAALGETMILNSKHEWSADEIEIVASHIQRNGLNPNQIART